MNHCDRAMHKNGHVRGKQQYRCPVCGFTVLEGTHEKAGRKPINDGLSKWQRYRLKKKNKSH